MFLVVLGVLRIAHVAVPLLFADTRPGPFVLRSLDEAQPRVGFAPLVPGYRPATLGEAPLFDGQGYVASAVAVAPTPGADAAARCAGALRVARAIGPARIPGFVPYAYPVTPYHGDYLEHFDLAQSARQAYAAAPSGSEFADLGGRARMRRMHDQVHELQRRRHLALLLGEVAWQDREPLDLLDSTEKAEGIRVFIGAETAIVWDAASGKLMPW